jgi:hypothetical protein
LDDWEKVGRANPDAAATVACARTRRLTKETCDGAVMLCPFRQTEGAAQATECALG